MIHKDYKAPTFENDIAILELESPIERQPHVVPICMPGTDTGGEEGFLGRMGIVTGWGRLEYGEDNADSDPHFIPAQYVTSAPQFWFYQKISRFILLFARFCIVMIFSRAAALIIRFERW